MLAVFCMYGDRCIKMKDFRTVEGINHMDSGETLLEIIYRFIKMFDDCSFTSSILDVGMRRGGKDFRNYYTLWEKFQSDCRG